MTRLLLSLFLLFTLASARAENYAERDEVRAFVADMASRHGFDAVELTALFARTHALPSVLKAIAPPTDPSIRSWRAYRSRFIEPRRLDTGLRFAEKHRALLAKAQARHGVPAEIVAAIIGVETIYGRNTGNFSAFAALTTLAFDYPPRADLFRGELAALLLLARDERRDPLSYRGSYAGAIGLPQFLPSSIRRWGQDFDGDGRIDLMGSPADAIGSVARFLQEHGWEEDGPIAVRVEIDGEAAPLIEEGIRPQRLPDDMRTYGVRAEGAPAAPAALIDLTTPGVATEYWLGYRNFFVLTRYNRSSFYAMTVYQFAEALKARRLERRRRAPSAGAAGRAPRSGSGARARG